MGAGGGNDAPAVVASVAAPAAHPVGAATQSSAAALAPSLPAAHEQRVTLYVDAEARSVRGLAELRVRADDTQVMLSAPGVRTLTAYCPEFGQNTSAADGQTGGAKELLMRPATVRWLRGKGAGMTIKPPAPDPSTTPAQLADLGFERYTEKLRAGLVPTADVVLSLPACASSSSCDSLLAVAFEVDVGAGGVVFDGPWARLGSKRAPMSLFVPTVASRGQLPPPTELLLRIAVPRGHSAVTGGRLVCSEPGSVLDGAGDAYTYRLPLSNGKGAFDSFMVACGPFLRVPDRELKGVSYLCPARKLDACRDVTATFPSMWRFFESYVGEACPARPTEKPKDEAGAELQEETPPRAARSDGATASPEGYMQVFLPSSVAPAEPMCMAGCSIFDDQLLARRAQYEEMVEGRLAVARAFAHQWFGCWIRPEALHHCWLIDGLATLLMHVGGRQQLGRNEMKWRAHAVAQEVIAADDGSLPPLCMRHSGCGAAHPYANAGDWAAQGSDGMLSKKAGCVVLMLESWMGEESMRKVVQMLVRRALSKGLQIGTEKFLETSVKVGGLLKDAVKLFEAKWVYGAGCPTCEIAYEYNLKRNVLEVAVHLSPPAMAASTARSVANFIETRAHNGTVGRPLSEACKVPLTPEKVEKSAADGVSEGGWSGDLMMTVTEIEGVYSHYPYIKGLHLTGGWMHIELACHARFSSRNKQFHSALDRTIRTKSALGEGEEATTAMHDPKTEEGVTKSNVLYLRVNGDKLWLMNTVVHQTESALLYQLERERDVTAQDEAIAELVLRRNVSHETLQMLATTMENPDCYPRVRASAARALGLLGQGPHSNAAFTYLSRYFRSTRFDQMVGQVSANDFSDLHAYHVRRALPGALAAIVDENGEAHEETPDFLLELLRFNNNTHNVLSDEHVTAETIEALGGLILPGGSETHVQVVKAIDHALKLDKCTSTTTGAISCAALRALCKQLGRLAHSSVEGCGVSAEDVASSIKALCEASAYDGDVKPAARAQALVILLSQELEAGGRSGGISFLMRLLSDPQRALPSVVRRAMLAPALTLIVEAPRDDSASELAALRGLLTAISSSSPVMGADARECAEVAYLLLQVISGCPRNLCRAVSLDFCQGVEYVATAKIEEGFAKIVTHGTKLGTTKAPKKKTKKKERVQFVDDDDNIQYMSEDELDPTVMSDTLGRGKRSSARAHSSKASKLIEAEQEDDDAFEKMITEQENAAPTKKRTARRAPASNVGRPVEIFFPEVGYYAGTVTAHDGDTIVVTYQEGSEETLSLSRDAQLIQFTDVGQTPAAMPAPVAAHDPIYAQPQAAEAAPVVKPKKFTKVPRGGIKANLLDLRTYPPPQLEGAAVKVYWTHMGKSYNGEVVEHRANAGPQCIHVYFTDGDKGWYDLFANGADITFTKLPQPVEIDEKVLLAEERAQPLKETAPSGGAPGGAGNLFMDAALPAITPKKLTISFGGKSAVKAAGPSPEKMSSKTTFKVKISRRDAGEGRPGATVATAITPGPVLATSQGPHPAVTPAPMTTLPSSTPASAASAPGITPGAPALTPTDPASVEATGQRKLLKVKMKFTRTPKTTPVAPSPADVVNPGSGATAELAATGTPGGDGGSAAPAPTASAQAGPLAVEKKKKKKKDKKKKRQRSEGGTLGATQDVTMGTVEVKRDVSLTSDDRGGALATGEGVTSGPPAPASTQEQQLREPLDQPTAGDIAAAPANVAAFAPAAAVDAAGAAGPSPNGPPQAPPDAGQQSTPGGADAEAVGGFVEDMMED